MRIIAMRVTKQLEYSNLGERNEQILSKLSANPAIRPHEAQELKGEWLPPSALLVVLPHETAPGGDQILPVTAPKGGPMHNV
jgi:hypothetical protein